MNKLKFLSLTMAVILTVSCVATLGIIKPNSQAKNEVIVTNELKQLLAENPRPKLVMRVTNPPQSVTEAKKLETHINLMEKIFMQNGFTVRDRALLEESLLRTKDPDYKIIGEKIDTDIIVEILELEFDIPNRFTTYLNKNTNQKERFQRPDNFIDCSLAKLACRLTLVKKGQLGAMFTFYISHCDLEDLYFVVYRDQGVMGWVGVDKNNKYVEPSYTNSHSLLAGMRSDEIRPYYTTYLTYNLIGQFLGEVTVRLKNALDLFNAHRYPEAQVILTDLIKKDPQNGDYFILTGMICARQNDFPGAEKELEKALLLAATARQRTSVYYAYSNFYALKNEKQLALSFLRKALEGGMTDLQAIRSDEDLMNISKSPEFEALLKEFQK